MKTIRLGLHSLVLALTNIGFIIVGFGIYYSLRPVNQIAVQAPTAAVLCIIGFLFWSVTVRRLPVKDFSLRGTGELAWTYLLALLWSPVIVVPLHYVTQGYLTSWGNIIGVWLFQIPTNLLALLAASTLARN